MRLTTLALLMVTLLCYNSYARESKPIADSFRTCQIDSDCMLVDKDCNDCCNFDAVAKASAAIFESDKKLHCGKPTTLCDCSATEDNTKTPICVEKRCVYK